jgi:hypothetical protein
LEEKGPAGLIHRHVVVDGRKKFAYDAVYGPGSGQDEIYNQNVKSMVHRFMDGMNVTVMAYGQVSC